jgi:chemotaxis protein methyltransferase CheR
MPTTAAELSPADFDYVRDFVKREAAITLEDGKEYLVTSRLAPLVRREGVSGLAELIAQLRARPVSPLGGDVVDALTTNETSFFRDVHPFESLRAEVLPALVRERAAERRLRIWCGASSSGQEPYCIAMTVRDGFPELAGWDVQILATDISPSMLEKARRAEYSQLEVNRGLPANLLVRHFTRVGARWKLHDDVAGMVRFERLNLAAEWPGHPTVDLVFLRNVLIYFDVPTKTSILRRIHRHLRPGGHLLLGGAETAVGVEDLFERRMLGRTAWYRAR